MLFMATHSGPGGKRMLVEIQEYSSELNSAAVKVRPMHGPDRETLWMWCVLGSLSDFVVFDTGERASSA